MGEGASEKLGEGDGVSNLIGWHQLITCQGSHRWNLEVAHRARDILRSSPVPSPQEVQFLLVLLYFWEAEKYRHCTRVSGSRFLRARKENFFRWANSGSIHPYGESLAI